MDNRKIISPVGENWSEYRRTHYTPEEIAENDLMVQLVGKTLSVVPLELSEKKKI